MRASKITEGNISDLKVASLPTRPTAPTSFGGKGFTATEMKEAFDKLPLYIIECFNDLIDSITDPPNTSVASEIKTGISDGHTLSSMFSDIAGGNFITYLSAFDTTLAEYLLALRRDIDRIASSLGITL